MEATAAGALVGRHRSGPEAAVRPDLAVVHPDAGIIRRDRRNEVQPAAGRVEVRVPVPHGDERIAGLTQGQGTDRLADRDLAIDAGERVGEVDDPAEQVDPPQQLLAVVPDRAFPELGVRVDEELDRVVHGRA